MDHLDDEILALIDRLELELKTISEIHVNTERINYLLDEIEKSKMQLSKLHSLLSEMY